MSNKKEYSLYIHIPFCLKKCDYCDFASWAGKEHLIDKYIEVLLKEIDFYAGNLRAPCLKTVYFGGGTPSLLDIKDFEAVLARVNKGFLVRPDAEISLEANPGTINFMKLAKLRGLGMNRISIGAQSFSDSMLKTLGRIHTAQNIEHTFLAARHAGFENINLDLMFALPGQTLDDWQRTLDKALGLCPDHISVYNLTIEEGTPFFESKNKLDLPSEDDEYKMFDLAIDRLTRSGFEHYEISNFAAGGKKCLNNLTYWDNESYIGAGVGAASYLGGRRYSNPKDLDGYMESWNSKAAGEKILADHKSFKRVKKAELSDALFLGLRKLEGVSIEEIAKKYGIDPLEIYKSEIDSLAADGLINIEDKRMKLSRKGLFLANEVFEKFV